MQVAYTVTLVIAVLIAILFSLLVFLTGKGDAMSGGSSIRTTFKGKASFEDMISRVTLILGISFMALMLVLDVLGNLNYRDERRGTVPIDNPAPANPAPANPTPPAPGTTTGGATGTTG